MKEFRHLYGPVPSRRLGRSLGIDLVPHKVCTYDCIYCQIGKTTEKTLLRKEYISREAVLEEVKAFLLEGSSSIDHFSLSGSGEPTLHSEIGLVIEGIKTLSSIPVAVITNGSLLYEERVRKELSQADIVLPSLDAVSPEVFTKINRPCSGLSVEEVVRGMVEFRKIYRGQIWLEILFCKGINDTRKELERMEKAIDRIQPDLIHINTVVRPPSEKWTLPLNQKEMEKIEAFFGKRAMIITEFDRQLTPVPGKEARERILRILKRRPLSLSDLSLRMGIPQDEMNRSIDVLVKEGKIQIRKFGDSIYCETKEDPCPS